MFFNLHTHSAVSETGVTAICNMVSGFDTLAEEGIFSIGLHPWYLEASSMHYSFVQLQRAAMQSNVWAVGECGLDKLCATPWPLQHEAFVLQVRLANSIRKPLVIHCVKAFNEVVAILQAERVTVPVIFHGFNKSSALALLLVSKGFYLSFGKHLQHERAQILLKQIPLQLLFLETDDATISIQSVYQTAANVLLSSIDALSLRLAENVQSVFGKALI